MRSSVALLLLILPALVLSFPVSPRLFGLSTITPSKLRAAVESPEIGTIRNMFQSSTYDKPIVLLGCSGAGDELKRLARSLSLELNREEATELNLQELQTERKTGSGGIVNFSGTNGAQLLRSIESKHLNFPDVIVLDFDDSDYAEVAKSLYEDAGVLSVYINVEAEEGQISKEGAERKQQLEESVFVKYSDYELCIKNEGLDLAVEQDSAWSHIEWELCRLTARALLPPATPGDENSFVNNPLRTMGQHTFFLSLSFPEITDVERYVEDMCKDVDAMEFRADLLSCRDSRFDLIYSQQLLRKYCRPHAIRAPGLPFKGKVLDDVMPIVYTVRTQNQIGTYPDDEAGISKMFQLLEWGLRSGVEVLDVESAHNPELTNQLLNRAEERHATQIIGSEHVAPEEVTTEKAVELFQQCALAGRAHGAKVVLSIKDDSRDRMAYEAALITQSLWKQSGDPVIPCVSLILGDVGAYSRVLNFPFTPVTHEALPFKAAPGQMTASEIMTTRLLTNLFDGRKYAILGHNIAYSVSPQMQGGAFKATRLPHEYFRADVETVEEFIESDFFKAPAFGGCSITIPHKQSIIPYVDVMSEAAKAIGSVNTLVVREDIGSDEIKRVIHGDNTDWRGIFNPLERKLGGSKDYGKKGFALIVGAGGTARAAAYAAEKLGLERIYSNRTPAKAVDLVESFGGTIATSLDGSSAEDDNGGKSLQEIIKENNGSLRVVISTLPAAAEFELPDWLLSKDLSIRPVVFDVNYKPYNTNLLLQAESAGLDVVRGSEMLWEQGVGQFEMWTGRTAPYNVMKSIVLENCLPQVEEEKVKDNIAEADDDELAAETTKD